jgi:hypothetical protein
MLLARFVTPAGEEGAATRERQSWQKARELLLAARRKPHCVRPSTTSATRRLGFEMDLDGAVKLADGGGECPVLRH